MGKLAQKKQAVTEQAVRESVYEAILQVLSDHGLEKLTMQKVARAAGIATGTLYNYFKDKDALLVYTAQRLFDQLRGVMVQACRKPLGADDKLMELIRSDFHFFYQNQAYFQFLDQAQVFCKMDMVIKHQHVSEVRQVIAGVIESGIREGVFKAVDVATTADFFHRAIVGTLCVRPELEAFDPEFEAQSLVKMLMAILK